MDGGSPRAVLLLAAGCWLASLPLIAINTTAGTASEMTRFCIITDEARHVKMAIVDRNVTPLLSVNDPALMVAMPKGLTAATGMDAMLKVAINGKGAMPPRGASTATDDELRAAIQYMVDNAK